MQKDQILDAQKIFHVVLLACLFANCAGCGVTSKTTPKPSPTLFVLPPRTIQVQPWSKSVKSICLVTSLDFPVAKNQQLQMDEFVRTIVTGLDLIIQQTGSSCDATMTLEVKAIALAGDYSAGTLYTGVDITGYAKLDAPDVNILQYIINIRNEPPYLTTFGENAELPREPGNVNFLDFWLWPLLQILEQIWGPRVYVWSMGINNNNLYTGSAKKIRIIGPQDDLLIDLMYAVRDSNENLRSRALIVLGDFAPSSNAAIPLFIESLQDPNWDVRFFAAKGLGKFGKNAKSAVPALEKALEQET